jgi:hypothetical protein
VWVSTVQGLAKLSATDGQTLLMVPDTSDVRALAVDGSRGLVWAYDRRTLRAFDTATGAYAWAPWPSPRHAARRASRSR